MNLKLAIATPDGEFIAHYTGRGLAKLEFPGTHSSSATQGTMPEQAQRWHALTTEALLEALQGREPRKLPPLDLAAGTEFQQQVWDVMRRIATGHTRSYAEVAAAIGKPGAARAVGGACGANPVPVFVPCHRVLAARQGLGGFSSGLDWKRKLLAREGVQYHSGH